MHEMGVKTESLDPPHNYVPWVVLDGVHNTTIQNMAMADLTALVCQTYQARFPTF
jgi:interferon gamma-inducible protein 30